MVFDVPNGMELRVLLDCANGIYLAANQLIAPGGCGGAGDTDPRSGIEPVTCSDQPNPCA